MEKLLLRPNEAAEALGVSRARLYSLVANGTIPSIRVGASIRISVDELREWINTQRQEGSVGSAA